VVFKTVIEPLMVTVGKSDQPEDIGLLPFAKGIEFKFIALLLATSVGLIYFDNGVRLIKLLL
jgi:hypothetical protein